MRIRSSWFAVMLLLLPAFAQDSVLSVTTRIVQMSVVAHDKSGAAVGDLTRDDFALFDNGKSRTISAFSIDSADRRGRPGSALPPYVYSNHLARESGTSPNATIVLLDGLNTQPIDQARAIPQLVRFLEGLPAGDPIAIYTLGLNGLRILQDFSTDSTRLKKALAAYHLRETPNLDPNEFRFDDFVGTSISLFDQAHVTRRAYLTLDTIQAIADHVSGVPGRKSLIWISASFPFTLGLEHTAEVGSINPVLRQSTFNHEVTRATQAVNRANLAIYPVDARGLMPPEPQGRGSIHPRFSPSRNEINSMAILAERTGGRAFYDTNDLQGAIRRAVDDARVSYTLGFYPPAEDIDGKYHELKVEVKRKGVEIRSRRGYLASLDQMPSAEQLKAAVGQAIGGPLEISNIRLTARLFRVPENPPGTVRVVVEIDPATLTIEPNGSRWTGGFHILFVQLSAAGATLDSTNSTVPIDLDRARHEKLRSDGVSLARDLPVKKGVDRLRIVVIDRPAGRLGSVNVPF